MKLIKVLRCGLPFILVTGIIPETVMAGAVRPGFDSVVFAGNDDGSIGPVSIGFSADFFGTAYTHLWVNNNGNVTFPHPLSTFTPFNLTSTATPIIAPFFADVDTRCGNVTRYGTGTVDGHHAFGVSWRDVDYYNCGFSPRINKNTFQLVLVERSDTGPGNFDIELNYDKVQWEAGTASSGSTSGLGGSSARAGFSNGTGVAGSFYEIAGSAIPGSLLDNGPLPTSLIHNSYNSPVLGRYLFQARHGQIVVVNQPPVANAGIDQGVSELTAINLNGTSSSDPDNDPLTYSWTQTAGPTVALADANTAIPSFSAPDISPSDGSQTLTFQLTVSDGQSDAQDAVNITVSHVNTKPVADAGDDANVREGVTYTLNGINSYDSDNDALTYQWTQVSGPSVALSDNITATPSFSVPLATGMPVVLQLVVNDGTESSDPSTVTITPTANNAPIANAGSADTKNEGSAVNLNGSLSSDPDGDGMTYQWTQTGGPSPVALTGADTATPSFTAPVVASGVQDDYTFSLVVTDDYTFNPKSSVAETVTIHVLNSNAPPQCQLAQASVARIWPPNHTMTPVAITGISDGDAEFNNVTINVIGITSDEPTNGLGDGDTSPDAVIQDNTPADSVQLRGERKGGGNGRVYNVNFSASDGWESCTGSVQVTVPHDRKGADAADNGQTVDATQP